MEDKKGLTRILRPHQILLIESCLPSRIAVVMRDAHGCCVALHFVLIEAVCSQSNETKLHRAQGGTRGQGERTHFCCYLGSFVHCPLP